MARKSRKNAEVSAIVSTPEQVYYTAAAYVRLSSDDRRKKGDSVETQKSIIENFIAVCPDIKLHDFYIDNGTTGTNFDRPAFQKMLSDLEAGVINCIIVKDLSRFGRNTIDSGYYIEKYLPSINARLIAVNDGFDSAHMGPSDSILLPLKNTINEAYALDISRKCRAVQQQYIREGKFVGRLAPYGYAK
ncbi:MAG: recombinase family protein, partial [Firmicutes bacterium]|nr:recombinase family protein [Bacillota bacterium]